MKALTIKQPWASLIISGAKDIENLDWPTGRRGIVAIHSSAKLDRREMEDACGMMTGFVPKFSAARFQQDTFPLGCILGIAEIVDCVQESDSSWFVGEYGFVIQFQKQFQQPIPCRGALGFWEVPAETLALMRQQYRLLSRAQPGTAAQTQDQAL